MFSRSGLLKRRAGSIRGPRYSIFSFVSFLSLMHGEYNNSSSYMQSLFPFQSVLQETLVTPLLGGVYET